MNAHPYADRFPMLGAEELDRLAADERITGTGGDGSRFVHVSVERDSTHPEYLTCLVSSDSGANQTIRPVRSWAVADMVRELCNDLDRGDIAINWHEATRRTTHASDENVYFVRDSLGNIKIGYARDVASRVAALQTANSMPLTLIGSMPGTISDEKAMHARFSGAHIRGEWFSPNADLLTYIAEVTR